MGNYAIKGRKILIEKVAFKDGDTFPPFCARVYLPEPWLHDVGYGPTEREAVSALMHRGSVQAYIASVEEGEQ